MKNLLLELHGREIGPAESPKVRKSPFQAPTDTSATDSGLAFLPPSATLNLYPPDAYTRAEIRSLLSPSGLARRAADVGGAEHRASGDHRRGISRKDTNVDHWAVLER